MSWNWLDTVSMKERGGVPLGSSCRSVWRHVHPELRAAPGPLHVHTQTGWQGPVSLPQGIARPLSDFLCRLLYKLKALHVGRILLVCVCIQDVCLVNVHVLKFIKSVNSQLIDISLVHDAIYHLCHGQSFNCKALLISLFQGFSGVTSPVRWAIDQGS